MRGNKVRLILFLNRVPILKNVLRWCARLYKDGSVVIIKNGYLAGYKWRRSHRYLSSYWIGTYELAVQECLIRELKPGNVFYDVGANAGFFSLLGSKCVDEKGRVFAFEPLPENIKAIKNQLELNQVSNCTLVEVALSDRNGEIELFEGEDTSTATLKARTNVNGNSRIVKSITLDEFAKIAPLPDFIKMDIEGAEALVLQKAGEILSSVNPPKLLIEFHSEELKTQGQSLLSKYGYRFFMLDGKMIDSGQLPHHVLAICCSTETAN
jgi:FkbM family methyltransferase